MCSRIHDKDSSKKKYSQSSQGNAALGIPNLDGLLVVLASADDHSLLWMPVHALDVSTVAFLRYMVRLCIGTTSY